MESLITMFYQALDQGSTDPLFIIPSFVLDFECIHPFRDGNGRIRRLLTLFLPTEGLFAEVIRRTGLVEFVQRECRVVIAGPTTLWALLNSLQMGFRTLAIEKRSSEVWNLLSAVKTEWTKYEDVLTKVQKKIHEASDTIEQAQTRTRAIGRKLKDVQELPTAEAESE